MELAGKLKAIRAKEGLTQGEICELLDFSLSTWKKYETSLFEMGFAALSKVLQHPRFTKYTLWVMTDTTAPDCGQVSPL
nr:helix-turn-helix transcriptional regulator [Pseudomonas nitroreducens]